MSRLAFLLDVDNTLIDNDKVKADLQERVHYFAGERASVFWEEYERVRSEFDYVDLPVTLQRFRLASPDVERFAEMAAAVLFYPFEDSVYPSSLEVVAHLRNMGDAAIVSDGDPVFQPAKIARAGLAQAVDGKVLIFVHKELHIEDIRREVPADVHVLIDDKPNILEAVKESTPDGIVTVHVHQGKYAIESHDDDPIADFELNSIADVLLLSAADFEAAANPG